MNYYKRYIEICLVTIILASVFIFLMYVFFSVITKNSSQYTVKAKFNEVGGLTIGAQVMIKGVAIGSVKKVIISNNYSIEVYLGINNNIHIPLNSKAQIKDSSLFSGRKIEIFPGSSSEYIKNNGKILDTEDYKYLEDKLGSVLFNK